jgi:hypothetical protein
MLAGQDSPSYIGTFLSRGDRQMSKFLVGFAYRGTTTPEVREVIEAESIRAAMFDVERMHGGGDLVLVTYAHGLPDGASSIAWGDGNPARPC